MESGRERDECAHGSSLGDGASAPGRWERVVVVAAMATVLIALSPWWEPLTTPAAALCSELVVALALGLASRRARGPRRRLGAKLVASFALCAAAAVLLGAGGEAGYRVALAAAMLASGATWLWGVPETRGNEAFFGAVIGVGWTVTGLMMAAGLLFGNAWEREVEHLLMLQLVFAGNALGLTRMRDVR